MSTTALPFEVQEFERLLQKPNSDPTGLAGYFNSGEVWVARVPARLDVIGGKLTEVNVTSPTGIQKMSKLDHVDYTARVIEWVERHAIGK